MSVGLEAGPPRVSLTTPEHVPLVFELAPIGSRILALALDLLVIVGIVLTIGVLATWALTESGVSLGEDGVEVSDGGLLASSLAQLLIFFVWNFYFIFVELRWQGRTIGKRTLGLRVIARDGGPLSSDLVFARNLTRDVEMLLPLQVIIFPEAIGIDSPLLLPLCWLWLGIMAFMPLFNRNRARVGDLVAGTLVVSAPREFLRRDLVDQPAPRTPGAPDAPAAAPEFAFTQAQLDLYGIHELQILEDVLRRYPVHVDHDLLEIIAGKIQAKIGWTSDGGGSVDTYRFLRAFYAAQRARLEHKMLFGKRQERKVR